MRGKKVELRDQCYCVVQCAAVIPPLLLQTVQQPSGAQRGRAGRTEKAQLGEPWVHWQGQCRHPRGPGECATIQDPRGTLGVRQLNSLRRQLPRELDCEEGDGDEWVWGEKEFIGVGKGKKRVRLTIQNNDSILKGEGGTHLAHAPIFA